MHVFVSVFLAADVHLVPKCSQSRGLQFGSGRKDCLLDSITLVCADAKAVFKTGGKRTSLPSTSGER